jgi:hypothetical protein
VEVDFVEAGVALVVKVVDDLGVRSLCGEHGVKAKLDVGWELGGFGARLAMYDWRFTIYE